MKKSPANLVRPFQYAGTKDRELFCDRVSLARLVREYGTPLYVYSANNILDRVRMFAEAFAGMRATLCYSVKANPNLSILQMLAETGAGFDIVSGGELERVRQAAKPSLRKVVFSGVGKTAAEMDAALAAQILVFNVESPAELDLLEQRARHLRKRAPVAMRVNPDVFAATHPYISTGHDRPQIRSRHRRCNCALSARGKKLLPGSHRCKRSYRIADSRHRALWASAAAGDGDGA